MNNEAEDRSMSKPAIGDGRSIPGQYVIKPYVCSDWDIMIEQETSKLLKVVIPLGIATILCWLIIKYPPSDLYGHLADRQDGQALLLVRVLIFSVSLMFGIAYLLYVVSSLLYFWADYRSKDHPSPVLPFLMEGSLSYKTSVFSTRRYWITKADIAEAVDGEIEFLTGTSPRFTGNDVYPAPARRQIIWVSSEDQEERTGWATMTRPDVVTLTDEHNRRITPDMVAWHTDGEYDDEGKAVVKPETVYTRKPGSNHGSNMGQTLTTPRSCTGGRAR